MSEAPIVQKLPSEEVLEMLLALPDKYKIILYLFYYEGYSSKEIVNLIGIKDGTVRARLSSGRKQLQLNLTGGHSNENTTVERLAGCASAHRNAEDKILNDLLHLKLEKDAPACVRFKKAARRNLKFSVTAIALILCFWAGSSVFGGGSTSLAFQWWLMPLRRRAT